MLFDNLRIHGKLTRHSETRSLPPLLFSLLSFIRIAMNILFRFSLLVLIINFVAAAPEPLAVSEARPDTFVVAKIPGVKSFVQLSDLNYLRGYGPWRG